MVFLLKLRLTVTKVVFESDPNKEVGQTLERLTVTKVVFEYYNTI